MLVRVHAFSRWPWFLCGLETVCTNRLNMYIYTFTYWCLRWRHFDAQQWWDTLTFSLITGLSKQWINDQQNIDEEEEALRLRKLCDRRSPRQKSLVFSSWAKYCHGKVFSSRLSFLSLQRDRAAAKYTYSFTWELSQTFSASQFGESRSVWEMKCRAVLSREMATLATVQCAQTNQQRCRSNNVGKTSWGGGASDLQQRAVFVHSCQIDLKYLEHDKNSNLWREKWGECGKVQVSLDQTSTLTYSYLGTCAQVVVVAPIQSAMSTNHLKLPSGFFSWIWSTLSNLTFCQGDRNQSCRSIKTSNVEMKIRIGRSQEYFFCSSAR